MIYGINYSNNSQYNQYNTNQNYFNKDVQNTLNSMYRSDSNFSNINKTQKMVYNGNYFEKKKNNKNKGKKVKIREGVEIIDVESYKEYNKIDEEEFNANYGFVDNRKDYSNSKKKNDNCECKLI